MSTKFERNMKLNGDPQKVLQMLQSEHFQNSRLVEAISGDSSISWTNEDFTVVLRRKDSLNEAPLYVRKALGREIDWVEIQTWPISLTTSETAVGSLEITVDGKPAKVTAVGTLIPFLGGSEITFHGKIKVDIRVFGSQLEKLIESFIEDVFEEVQKEMNKWLAQETPS